MKRNTLDSTLLQGDCIPPRGTQADFPEKYSVLRNPQSAGVSMIEGAVLRTIEDGTEKQTSVSFVVNGRLYVCPPMGNIRN